MDTNLIPMPQHVTPFHVNFVFIILDQNYILHFALSSLMLYLNVNWVLFQMKKKIEMLH